MLRRCLGQQWFLTVATGNSPTISSSRSLRHHHALACGAAVVSTSSPSRRIVGPPSSALVQHRRYPPSTAATAATAATTTTLIKRSLHLAPREVDHLLLHQVGRLAQYRLARGLKLNVPEARALIAMQMM